VAEASAVLILCPARCENLGFESDRAGFHIVVSGHSHKPGKTERDGVVYINPGSAGPRRFQLPVTVARLNLSRIPMSGVVNLEVSATN